MTQTELNHSVEAIHWLTKPDSPDVPRYNVRGVFDTDGLRNATTMTTNTVYCAGGGPKEDTKTTLIEIGIQYANYHGYIASVVCVLGLMANIANIVVLTRKNMRSSVNLLLTWLAVADLLTMTVCFPFLIHFYIMRPSSLPSLHTHSKGWATFLLIYSHFSLYFHTIAIWLTICLAIFRYLFVSYPVRGPIWCNVQRAKITIALVYTTVSVMLIPNYLSNEIVQPLTCGPHIENGTLNATNGLAGPVYTVDQSQLSTEHEVIPYVNYWTQAILFKLIPCFLLIILTLLLVKVIHRANQRRMKLKSQGRQGESEKHREQNRTTTMLLVVVILFLITELPQGIISLLSGLDKYYYKYVYTPLGDFLDMSAILNNSINFVLYCTMSTQFRQTFVELFCFKCRGDDGWMKMNPIRALMNGHQKTTKAPQNNGKAAVDTSQV